ncbi:MAG: hypothetical protein ABIP55_15300 [Tepidisphaeraceae bacterium]
MNPAVDFTLSRQIFWLLALAIPIACVARTVVYEEVFREPREWCKNKSEMCAGLLKRKFFYLFTCEYCFSHYVTAFFIWLTKFRLLINDWRGYVLAFFALVFVANVYLNFYARLKVDITSEKKDIERKEKEIEHKEIEIEHKEKEVEKMDAEIEELRAR